MYIPYHIVCIYIRWYICIWWYKKYIYILWWYTCMSYIYIYITIILYRSLRNYRQGSSSPRIQRRVTLAYPETLTELFVLRCIQCTTYPIFSSVLETTEKTLWTKPSEFVDTSLWYVWFSSVSLYTGVSRSRKSEGSSPWSITYFLVLPYYKSVFVLMLER